MSPRRSIFHDGSAFTDNLFPNLAIGQFGTGQGGANRRVLAVGLVAVAGRGRCMG